MAISNWLRALWTPTAQPPLEPAAHPEVAQHVARAEAAYDRMSDARHPKADYDDAQLHFSRAIDAAKRLGLDDQVQRLSARRDHVTSVYDSQPRGV
jgi:hypothetical protein